MDFGNRKYFDCRRYVRPGDRIQIKSMWSCDGTDDVSRRNSIMARGIVTAVYERFVKVRLKRVEECVNRNDIFSVNGMRVKGGNFRHFEVRR